MPEDGQKRVAFPVDATAASADHITLRFDHGQHSFLTRAQVRLQDGKLWRLGNLISDLRYWLWRLIR